MTENIDYGNINYLLRVVGQVGGIALALVLFRLYKIFASPLTQKRHKNFIYLLGISILISFILLAMNYVLPAEWFPTFEISFNVVGTYALALYLYHQGNILGRHKDSDEYINLSRAMDAMIVKLKTR